MKTKFILPLTLSVVIFGCNTTSENKKQTETQEIAIETTIENHNHNEDEAIVLDDGNKWIVVPEMMAFIKEIESDVIEFSKKEEATFKEHQQLAILVDKNLVELTSNCTMKGKAHDELHKWLVPFLDLSTEYDEIKSVEEANAIFNKMLGSYDEFNTYFE